METSFKATTAVEVRVLCSGAVFALPLHLHTFQWIHRLSSWTGTGCREKEGEGYLIIDTIGRAWYGEGIASFGTKNYTTKHAITL